MNNTEEKKYDELCYTRAQEFMADNWVEGLMYQERVNRLKLLLKKMFDIGYSKGYMDCFDGEE